MRVCFITFRSITYAQRAQELLRRSGMGTSLGRTPRSLEQKGCGYSLRVPFTASQRALSLLRQNNVPFGRLYCQNENGELEAIT